jgi:hypothetical protein
MLQKHKDLPHTIVSIPFVWYLVAVVFLALGAIPIFLADSLEQAAGLIALPALGLVSLGVAIHLTRTVRTEHGKLIIKSPFGRKEWDARGGSLDYRYSGTASRGSYSLFFCSPDTTAPVRLFSLGAGMSMKKEIEKAQWVADTLSIPFHVAPNIVQAAQIQAKAFGAAKSPWLLILVLFGIMGLGGVSFMLVTSITDDDTGVRVVCTDHYTIEVAGKRYESSGTYTVPVEPGTRRVRLRDNGNGQWKVYEIDVGKGEIVEFDCSDPPPARSPRKHPRPQTTSTGRSLGR